MLQTNTRVSTTPVYVSFDDYYSEPNYKYKGLNEFEVSSLTLFYYGANSFSTPKEIQSSRRYVKKSDTPGKCITARTPEILSLRNENFTASSKMIDIILQNAVQDNRRFISTFGAELYQRLIDINLMGQVVNETEVAGLNIGAHLLKSNALEACL